MDMKRRQGSGGQSRWALPLTATLFLAAAFVVWRRAGEGKVSSPVLELVPRKAIVLGNDAEYREIAERRLPVILTSTIADKWPARETFSTKFLSSKLQHVSVHKQEIKRSFITFHDHKPLEPLVPVHWEDYNLKLNTTIPEILQWNNLHKSKLTGPFMYYSQDIATLRDQFPDVIGYVQPIKPLILSNEDVQVNLWVGREGIITHTHYDCTYNFFVQLQGKKRFTLFPPSQSLYLYPCLHPHYGHSQVDILDPDMALYPDYTNEGGLVAEVSPGDMLVVPPFWFHHVETLSESVSVNVWSNAPEYSMLNQIYALPVPFQEEWSWKDLLLATKIYIDMIVGSVVFVDGPDGNPPSVFVLRKILQQRYMPLVSAQSLSVNDTLLHQLEGECNQADWTDVRQRFQNTLKGGVASLVDLFKTMPNRDTMEICVANYLEHLVSSIVGLEYVYPFMATCALIQME